MREKVFWVLLVVLALAAVLDVDKPTTPVTVTTPDGVSRQKPCELPNGEADPLCVKLEEEKALLKLGRDTQASVVHQRVVNEQDQRQRQDTVPDLRGLIASEMKCEKRDPGTGECLMRCTTGQNNQNCVSLENKNHEFQEVRCKKVRCELGYSPKTICYRCERIERTVCYWSPMGMAGCVRERTVPKQRQGPDAEE
jgi:hypothetical protein